MNDALTWFGLMAVAALSFSELLMQWSLRQEMRMQRQTAAEKSPRKNGR
ncbi:MAG: hypothetical protein WCQ89_15115 [Verrucomicrobiota bacterium]|jgi:hypothetical protein